MLFNNRDVVAESKDCKLSHRTKSKGLNGANVLSADRNTNACVQYRFASPSISCQPICKNT